MAMSSQWDKCHKIDMNSSKKQLLYIWSLVASTPEGTPLMQTSWWEHRGACAGCRSVESHLFMEGGFVCEWQVASCSEGSPSAKHVRTHVRVKHWLCRISKKMDGATPAALNKLLTFWIADIWLHFCVKIVGSTWRRSALVSQVLQKSEKKNESQKTRKSIYIYP